MFVSPTARDALRAQRRETFFSDVVDPMVAEAKAVGIPLDEVVACIQRLAGHAGKEDR
jgi:DNA-binding transcriptional regulator YhcF (GntR family)